MCMSVSLGMAAESTCQQTCFFALHENCKLKYLLFFSYASHLLTIKESWYCLGTFQIFIFYLSDST